MFAAFPTSNLNTALLWCEEWGTLNKKWMLIVLLLTQLILNTGFYKSMYSNSNVNSTWFD